MKTLEKIKINLHNFFLKNISLITQDDLAIALLQSTLKLMIATDLDGKIIFFNNAAEKLLGYSAEDVVGKHTPALWHKSEEVVKRATELSRELGRSIQPGFEVFISKLSEQSSETRIWTFICKNQSQFTGELTVTIINDAQGNPLGFLGSIIDITKQIEVDAVLEREKLATKSAKIGTWDWYIPVNILVWSDTAFDVYNVEKVNQSNFVTYEIWRNTVHPEDIIKTEKELNEALAGGKKFDTSFRILWQDGSIHYIRGIAEVHFDENGVASRVIGCNWDISSEYEVARLKNEFLSMVSHEIRTPLNGLIGTIDILSDSKLNPAQHKYIGIIKKSGYMLMNIINDVLDFTKIEEKRFSLMVAPFTLSRTFEEQLFLFKPSANDKNIDLKLNISSSIPDYLIGDDVRIRQIIGNLISNAIKFTASGEVIVEVKQQEVKGDQITIKVTVSDTGDGISGDKISQLFEPFVQLSTSSVKRAAGTGLGLSICKKLVEMMQGEIGVLSSEGLGSIFWFTIKLKISNEKSESVAPIKPQFANESFRGKHILVVEDVETNQFVVSEMLTSLECTFDIAVNGQDAVDMVINSSYDLILMDCMMPVMDGYEATRLIRQNGFKDIIIVALTANAMSEDRINVINSGMNDYLSKPIVKNDLIKVIKKWC